MSIGERIVELRTQNQMTQYELAKVMEVSRQAVSKWENDQSSPDAMNLIRLSEILDTDIEYLTTGRRTFGRRPPVVLKSIETVERVVEKPVIVEKTVNKVVEVPVIEYVEKPIVRKITRVKHIRNPVEFACVGFVCFLAGLMIGLLF